jgi:hypothetical protein
MTEAPEIEANELSVRQELQADCFAGVWENHAGKRNHLEEGDVEEGLSAAQMIGDDLLQERATGMSIPSPSRTAPRNRGATGSGAASRPVASINATRFARSQLIRSNAEGILPRDPSTLNVGGQTSGCFGADLDRRGGSSFLSVPQRKQE